MIDPVLCLTSVLFLAYGVTSLAHDKRPPRGRHRAHTKTRIEIKP